MTAEALDRFFGFEREIELALSETVVTADVRDMVCIVRGRLELCRDHGDVLEPKIFETAFARISSFIGDRKWRRSFLRRLRMTAAYAQIQHEHERQAAA